MALYTGWNCLIIDGDGWKKGAIQWLKESAQEKKYTDDNNKEKVVKVMNLI